jgi:endonuclease/exonuclease/phosphatase family metal-dependent hydrolase
MSDPAIDFFARTQWTDCFGTGGLNGSDCDTNKGFAFARITLAPGAEIDLYDLHADAGQDAGSRAARQANILQLISFINTNSSGRAVIVLGDTNSLYTRSTDNIGLMLSNAGLQDAWIQSALGGTTPGFSTSPNNSGCPPPRGNAVGGAVDASGASCELIDKIFFRSSAQLELTLLKYEVLLNFVDGSGASLSDHLPVTARFDYQLVPEPTLAVLLSVAAASIASRRRPRL